METQAFRLCSGGEGEKRKYGWNERGEEKKEINEELKRKLWGKER